MFDNLDFIDLKYITVLLLPLLIIISPSDAEITVYRMSQFDVGGVNYGCRSSNINLEIKSLATWSSSRHCVLTKIEDLTLELYADIKNKAGGLIIQMPHTFSNLSDDTKQRIYQIEQNMLASQVKIPVYFSQYNSELENIIEEINSIDNGNKVRTSTFSNLMLQISSNGYQAITSGSLHTPNKKSKLPIIQGELIPNKKNKNSNSSRLPTILITSNIPPFHVNNQGTFNPDTALLLTIVEFFSKIYNKANTSPDYKLLFLVSESGPLLNFQGTKKWLEENQIQDVHFVMCLDTIVKSTYLDEDNSFYMHVSKPPKDGSHINSFYKLLKESLGNRNKSIEGVHKKINLAENQLAWDHERFGIKKNPSFTLSGVKSFKSPARTSVILRNENELINELGSNAEIIIEALLKYIFSIKDQRLASSVSMLKRSSIESWKEVKSSLQNNDVKNAFEKFLKNVKVTIEKPEYRDPEFMLYNGPEAQLNIYNVKPAVFDLFLTILISAYLFSFYVILKFFPKLYNLFESNAKFSKTY